MTSQEDDQTGRQPDRKITSYVEEDKITGRLPPTKKNIGRRTRRKTTSQTDELQPTRIKMLCSQLGACNR